MRKIASSNCIPPCATSSRSEWGDLEEVTHPLDTWTHEHMSAVIWPWGHPPSGHVDTWAHVCSDMTFRSPTLWTRGHMSTCLQRYAKPFIKIVRQWISYLLSFLLLYANGNRSKYSFVFADCCLFKPSIFLIYTYKCFFLLCEKKIRMWITLCLHVTLDL